MSAFKGKLSLSGALLFSLAVLAVPVQAEQPADSFAHGGGFYHSGEWDGGFGPGFVGAFVDPGKGIERPYLYGGAYGYHDRAPVGYDYGDCRMDKQVIKEGNRRRIAQFRDCH